MKSPFSASSFGTAFAPMFDDSVKIVARRGSRTVRGTFAACVFPIEADDPMTDDCVSSSRQKYSVLMKRGGLDGWIDETLPQIGDEVEVFDGIKARVSAVSIECGTLRLEARQI